MAKFGFPEIGRAEDSTEEKITLYRKWQPKIWRLMEDPHSSRKAKVSIESVRTLLCRYFTSTCF